MNSIPSHEKPLNRGARTALLAGAATAVLVFYLFATLAVVLLAALLLCELVLVLALLRFGLAGMMVNVMQPHLDLLKVFLRSFWLRSGMDFNLPLARGEAPGLFAIVDRLCVRLDLPPPREVTIRTDVTAWVRLNGWVRGGRNTVLGLGYDLLAGLTETEVEAVIAHEMVHAKLVRRGFRAWCSSGVSRVGVLAGSLLGVVEAYAKAKRSTALGGGLLRLADGLGKLSARLYAACSRQDEFDADIGAARLCGAASIRTSLEKLEALSRMASRVPWHERVARLQSGVGYGRWLVDELAAAHSIPSSGKADRFFSRYSTHPSLRDRLAALPTDPDKSRPTAERPAVEALLADPDRVASKLAGEIHRHLADLEAKDSRSLLRWNRKQNGLAAVGPVQSFAVVWLIVSLVIGLSIAFVNGFTFATMTGIVLCAGIGAGLLWHGRPKDLLPLPVPSFDVFLSTRPKFAEGTDIQSEQTKLEGQLRLRLTALPPKANGKQRAWAFGQDAYDALVRCDYLKAHVASRLSQQEQTGFVPGHIALAVASAALEQTDQARAQLQALHRSTRLRTRSSQWAAAWSLLLLGDWAAAESFLDGLVRRSPWDPSLLALLAHCQAKRGKFQGAVNNARLAVEKAPESLETLKLLINVLLASGQVREAAERLSKVKNLAERDSEMALALARIGLLTHGLGEAERWSQELRRRPAPPHILVQLGRAHELARRDATATAIYGEVLQQGHFPEAHLGLGRISAFQDQTSGARGHLLAALDLVRPLGDQAVGVPGVIHEVLAELLKLGDPVADGRFWTAKLPPNTEQTVLANTTFAVCGSSRADAESRFAEVLGAFRPGHPPLLPGGVVWEMAPAERQPDGPVLPGVHAVF